MELKTITYCLYIKMSLRNQFWKLQFSFYFYFTPDDLDITSLTRIRKKPLFQLAKPVARSDILSLILSNNP